MTSPRVPWYIDANARHEPSTMRLLAYMALAGREGVLGADHLAVRAMPTPSGQIRVAPGAFGINNTALGGQYEAYVDKLPEQVVADVNATDAAARTDLVVCRVKNPYVEGTGDWPIPLDAVNGPYWDVDVIHGVPPNTTSVHVYNAAYSAITLARIQRPANTGIVLQSHITDLRSLVDLSGERIIIVDNPPAEPPPVTQQYWTESTPIDQSGNFPSTQKNWTNWPEKASWPIPVPPWAMGFDLNVILNPEVDGNVWGEMRPVINNGSIQNDPCGIIPSEYDFNYKGGPGPERNLHMIGGTGTLQPAHRGKVVNFRLQTRSSATDWISAHPGKLYQTRGTRVNIWINFKKYPVTSD